MTQTTAKDIQSSQPLLLRQAEDITGKVFDMRIDRGCVVDIGVGLSLISGDNEIDCRGRLLLPGLHDHHLHLLATAAAKESVLCGPPAVHNENELGQQLISAAGSGWIRGTGFHESVCSHLNRVWLDELGIERPIRIQHRSGMMWVLNSVALQLLDVESLPNMDGLERDNRGVATGRFYNLDAWLGEKIQRQRPDLSLVSKELAEFGITHVTDAGVNNDAATWAIFSASQLGGELKQKVHVMGNQTLTSCVPNNTSRLTVGPVKLYLREINLPPLNELREQIIAAHDVGRAVAFHCVTLVEIHVALAALTEAGTIAGDRIEHASITDEFCLGRLAELDVTVVTQPNFIFERGEQYLKDVAASDQPYLYRGKGFLDSGITLAAGSDAPYGHFNPWQAMTSAVQRKTSKGSYLLSQEALTPLQALKLFCGSAQFPGNEISSFVTGEPADLILLNKTWQQMIQDLSTSQVDLTLIDGRICYSRHNDLFVG